MSVTIVRGADKQFTLTLTVKKTGKPYDLTNLVSAKCKLKKQDGTSLVKTLGAGVSVLGAPNLGTIVVNLAAETDTPLLQTGDQQPIEFTTEVGTASVGDPANDVQIFLFDGEAIVLDPQL